MTGSSNHSFRPASSSASRGDDPGATPLVRYATVVVDPPWEYDQWRSTTEPAYRSMTLDEIRALPVRDIATPDAHLYCWAVLPRMAEAFDVVRAWGFKPSTVLTWCKPGVGLGGGFRGNTEHLIVARLGEDYLNLTCSTCGGRQRGAKKCDCTEPIWIGRGQLSMPARSFLSVADGTWYSAPRGEHSAKPELFMDLIEQMSPAPRVELFARRNRLGWDTWGDESLGTAELPERESEAGTSNPGSVATPPRSENSAWWPKAMSQPLGLLRGVGRGL